MNKLEPVKGAFHRRFQPSSYKKNDGKAKQIVINYLKHNGHVNISSGENYSFDISSEKNGHKYYSEVEMKNQWNRMIPPTAIANWNPTWKEIRIPHRKIKLINKFREMNDKDAFFNFYVIRRDCEFAWRIKDYQMTQECIKEIWLGNVGRKEHFFHIPYEEAELVNLKEKI
tara:strand:- start:1224 stop:1736 length:513 start_codon:yes stop_codon:yes gene_type:complete